MVIRIGKMDRFEDAYIANFKQIATHYGQFIQHEKDRSVLDLGLQLTLDTEEGTIVTDSKVWFQLKGIQDGTLSAEQFDSSEKVKYRFDVDHLRFWYRYPEAVYIVFYIESKNIFLAEDVCNLVSEGTLNALPPGQQSFTVQIPTRAVIDERFWQKLLTHKSMRIDRGSFKGNPLPHDRDVVTDVLQRPAAPLFHRIVAALLAEHQYQAGEQLDATGLFSNAAEGSVSVGIGNLHSTYEWIPRITAQFIPDEDGSRYEGQVFRAWGKCAVLVHGNVTRCLDISELQKLRDQLQARGITHLLSFINHYSMGYADFGSCPCFGEYRQGISVGSDIQCFPQHLEDISFNVLTAANVYRALADEMRWMSDYIAGKLRTREWRVV